MAEKPKWHYPLPPTPRILHFPRRHRRKPSKTLTVKPFCRGDRKGKLGALFDQEDMLPVMALDCDENWRKGVGSDGGGVVVKGGKKIHGGKENITIALDEEIKDLAEKLVKFRKCSGGRRYEVRKCSNFDQFEGISNQNCVKEDVVSTHKSRETMFRINNICSGQCKAIVQKLLEQVRAETEQWSQMQEMLGKVRNELEELQAARDFWEDQALGSDYQIQFLLSAAHEWRQKARSSESKTNALQAQLAMLTRELEKLRKEQNAHITRTKTLPPVPPFAQNETEKQVLICHLKENRRTSDNSNKQMCRRKVSAPKRSPFRIIGNSSNMVRENRLQCHMP